MDTTQFPALARARYHRGGKTGRRSLGFQLKRRVERREGLPRARESDKRGRGVTGAAAHARAHGDLLLESEADVRLSLR